MQPQAKEFDTVQPRQAIAEPLDPALESKRDPVEDALAHLDNKQKFDWLRRKRNEIQVTMLRQDATSTRIKEDIAALRSRMSDMRGEIDYLEEAPQALERSKRDSDELTLREKELQEATMIARDDDVEGQLIGIRDNKRFLAENIDRIKSDNR